ncbi:hypothetical protein BDW75DRAFT_219085 [Aspergillus navahoensis]
MAEIQAYFAFCRLEPSPSKPKSIPFFVPPVCIFGFRHPVQLVTPVTHVDWLTRLWTRARNKENTKGKLVFNGRVGEQREGSARCAEEQSGIQHRGHGYYCQGQFQPMLDVFWKTHDPAYQTNRPRLRLSILQNVPDLVGFLSILFLLARPSLSQLSLGRL